MLDILFAGIALPSCIAKHLDEVREFPALSEGLLEELTVALSKDILKHRLKKIIYNKMQ